MQKKVHRFFVYGTLKSGYGNNRLFQNSSSRKLGDFKTQPIYTMFDGPFPIVERDGSNSISGEVWETDSEEVARRVNSLEGCTGIQHDPRNWYDFDVIDTPFGPANIFVMNKGNCKGTSIVESGEWRAHYVSQKL